MRDIYSCSVSKTRLSTGLQGLDRILNGGVVEGYSTLLRGPPGAGKTIAGLHFLTAGDDDETTPLFINLGEPNHYVKETAREFDLGPENVTFLNLSPTKERFVEAESYSLFESAEVEQPSYVQRLRDTVEELEPDRVLLDPITEFRYLTTDEHQFRKQILSLLDFLKSHDATVMLTSQASESISDSDLQFLTDAVISLDSTPSGRTVRVSKFRGSSFQRGYHTYTIAEDGVSVWPRLTPDKEIDPSEYQLDTLSSGVPELDELLNGGVETGTVTFLSGPTGVGKTTTGLQFLKEAAAREKRSVLFSFEESKHTLLHRAESVNIPIRKAVENGNLSIVEVLPEELTVDEFGDIVRSAVEDDVELVMIDGIRGFIQNVRGTRGSPYDDILRIGRYLRSQDVTTIMVSEVNNITGDFRATEEGTSNLADNIVFLRHVEVNGELRKVIGALKMRTSDFERSLRELEITEYGLRVGEPLPKLRGILTGTPEWNETTSETR